MTARGGGRRGRRTGEAGEAGEAGIGILELVIAMAFMMVIGALAVTALSSSTRAVGQVDDEARGLADMQTVVERMSRDLRAARGVDGSSSASQLTVWVDFDSDYRQTASETITWKIQSGSSPGQFDVIREDGLGSKSIVGYSLVSDIAFSYGPEVPPKSQTVSVELQYDAFPNEYATQRINTFEIRLRNVQ
jgi:type II secretory pathway pseudopilin PulG